MKQFVVVYLEQGTAEEKMNILGSVQGVKTFIANLVQGSVVKKVFSVDAEGQITNYKIVFNGRLELVIEGTKSDVDVLKERKGVVTKLKYRGLEYSLVKKALTLEEMVEAVK